MENKWLLWATELQAIAQAGLAFSQDKYDLERFQKVRDIAISIVHEHTGVSYEKVRDLFASETGYQTPKVDIRSAIIENNKILRVREKADGAWSLPGGYADINTSVGESAKRECLEEAGATVIPRRIIAIHHGNRRNNLVFPYTIYKIFVGCELTNMQFRENSETFEAGFFELDSLPLLSSSRNTREQIKMCFDAREQRVFEAVFD